MPAAEDRFANSNLLCHRFRSQQVKAQGGFFQGCFGDAILMILCGGTQFGATLEGIPNTKLASTQLAFAGLLHTN